MSQMRTQGNTSKTEPLHLYHLRTEDKCDLNSAFNIGTRFIMLIPSLRDENGLGIWLTSKDKVIPKTRRKTHSSHGKSVLSQRSPASKGRPVGDCYDQTTLELFARSKNPAMVNAVETLSAITPTGEYESMQQTEAWSHRRNNVPVKRGKAHDNDADFGQEQSDDSSREKGGTQEFLTVHSQL